MKRKLLALILALLLCQGLVDPALAVVEEIATLKVDEVTGYSQSDGVYTVIQDGLYGFYRADGTELAPPKYAYAEDFQDGMAVVSPENTGRYGYVDLEGRLSIAAQYRQAFPFAQDRAFAVRERSGVLVMLDREGRELASFPDAALQPGDRIQFSEGLAIIPIRVEKGETEEEESASLAYRVVDLEGRRVRILTDAYVDFENGYHDGRIAVANAGEWIGTGYGTYRRFQAEAGSWGYRDAAGRLVVVYQYDEAACFSEGMAGVGRREDEGRILYGFIDPDGNEIFPLEYDGFVSCVNGSGAVLDGYGRWAYVDAGGRILTGFQFSEVSNFTEDVARVWTGGRRELVDAGGAVLFTVEDQQVLPCSGGVVPVQNAEGLWGIYDRNGKLLVDFEYDRAFHWDGYLWLKRGDLWRVYVTEDVIADRAAAAAAADEDTVVEPVAAVGTFSDVPLDAYYARAVTWATDSDIVTGTGGGQFSPERACTTGEILMSLWRAAGRPEPQIENPFVDVSPSHYYYQAALWAYENGLAEGEIFAAANPCTRAMVVTYLWGLDGRPFGLTDVFSDVALDAPYAQAVAWAVDRGIPAGSEGGLFEPDRVCNRGQIVTFLYRYMGE
ncbi:MAG: WG repeat-containing protein [Oscillospiraceae bacterium]|nr:WG repeat-containing protein [Oscillospiraceae bacterium]